MAKKTSETIEPRKDEIIPVDVVTEMKDSYLAYAMSVITARALPDVRDGLKPVHRRILFAMHEMGLTATSRFRKSAAVVGDVLGKYHPHGDVAVYDSMVGMAQEFSFRYPLILGQGNFGCFTKDTKVRLLDGRNLTFGELVEEDKAGKRNYTFTVKNGKITVALIQKPRLTKKDAEIMKVILDNGEEIKCTLNHKFLLKNGTYVEAQDLVPGTSLMPVYTRLSEEKDSPLSDMSGYEMILQPDNNSWEFVHHLSDAYNLDLGVYTVQHGKVRHHVDFNKHNNSPENIRRMKWLEHWKLHSDLAAWKHKNDPIYVKKLAQGRNIFWNKEENRQKYANRISERNKKNWQDAGYREHMREVLREVNIQYVKDNPEVRKIASKRLTATLKRLWQESGYRKTMHEHIIKGNKNHKTNRTGKLKFDTVCKQVILGGKELSEKTYEETRLSVYPYGSATTWNTGLKKYYEADLNKLHSEFAVNHKVKKIVFLKDYEDVYDLTINETHNFALAAGVFVHNSIDGDGAAAMRYTEAKMSKIASELLRDLEKETVDFRPNYDQTRKEPIVFPSAVPALLLNGTLGIAVGMATNIPPHNLAEVVDATLHLIENVDATTEDLLQFIKGPDFPTGGIAYNYKDLLHAYGTGRGGVVCRGEAEIVEQKEGFQIIITSIPFRVNKSNLIMSIAELVQEKKLEGVKGLRDESTKDIRIVIDLKNNAVPEKVLNYIYKNTQLESNFNFNIVALVDGVPQTLSLKSILDLFISHRKEIVKRRAAYDLRKAEEREHILLGLKKALDKIDRVISVIRASKDAAIAKVNLMKEFKFSELQTIAILEMKLQKLAGLERKAVEDELREKQDFIKEMKELLASPKKILGVISGELKEVRERYADERRTKIVKSGNKEIKDEDLIPEKETVLVYTQGGYVKRTDPSEYRSQKRGGVGVVDLETKEEDFVTMLVSGSTHSDLLFFTNLGKAYQMKMYDIPEGRRATKGKSIMNFLSLASDEKVTSILTMPKELRKSPVSLMLLTKGGTVKKMAGESFKDVRRSGIIAIRLDKGDQLVSALIVQKGDEVMMATGEGQSIRFKESDVREMGRTAGGVRSMKLKKNDTVISVDAVKKDSGKDSAFLSMSANGFGKKTYLKEYKVQKRGGSGIKTAKVTGKTGKLIVAKVLLGDEEELIAMSKKGQVIRTALKDIPNLGRQTQGVTIMRLRAGDGIASLACL